jgi:small multidrug resistance family-3 protein
MTWIAWVIFTDSALLEVGGDAMIRRGLRYHGFAAIAIGFIMLGSYGVLVNTVKWDFSKLLGVYVAIFAVISVIAGKVIFKEFIPWSTWIGIAIISIGGFVIQFGDQFTSNPKP